MVLRDHDGRFMATRTHKFVGEMSVCEAKSIGVRETLSWIKEMQRWEDEVIVESDSQITVHAIQSSRLNYLEVWEIIESCKRILRDLHKCSVVFTRKNANR